MSVEQDLQQIMSARYGKDVRQSIHDAIYDINEVAKRAEYDASTAPESARAYAEAALASLNAAQAAQQAAEDAAAEAMSGTPAGYADVVADVYSLKENTGTYLANPKSNIGRVLLDKMYGMSLQNGTPTPSVPVAIKNAKANLKCVGKNLIPYPFYSSNGEVTGVTYTINDDNSITANGTGTAIGFFFYTHRNQGKSKISPNNYVLRVEILGGSFTGQNSSYFTIALRQYVSPDGSFTDKVYQTVSSVSAGDVISLPFTISENDFATYPYHAIWFEHHKDNVFNNFTFRYSLELADVTDTTYEPYKYKDIITDLVLRAIEVTSTDNYNLVKDGKYYVADTLEKIDGGYQITRRIGEVTYDGSEDENWVFGIAANNHECFAKAFSFKEPPDNDTPSHGYSNRFATIVSKNTLYSNKYEYNQYALAHSGTWNDTCIMLRVEGATSLNDVTTWLSNNNVIVVAELKTPTIETVTDANAIKLLSLKSYDEATYVAQTEDTEGVVVLEYGSTNFATKALSGYVEAESNSIRIGLLENA